MNEQETKSVLFRLDSQRYVVCDSFSHCGSLGLIDCSFSTRIYRGRLAIRLVPEEGDEATLLATLVTVEQVVPLGGCWMLAPLVRTMITLRIRQAFHRLEALLEDRQKQAEQGLNAVYTCWQQVQAERERFHRQLLAPSLHYRRW